MERDYNKLERKYNKLVPIMCWAITVFIGSGIGTVLFPNRVLAFIISPFLTFLMTMALIAVADDSSNEKIYEWSQKNKR